MRRVLTIPDTHVPYQDQKALELALQAGRAYEPTDVVLLGDFADFFCLSTFAKNPEKEQLLMEEVDEVSKCLDMFDTAFPKAKKIFILGNHEDRLERYLQVQAPEIYGLVTVSRLFELGSRGWKVIPYGGHHKIGKLLFTHGDITRQNVARAMVHKYKHSVCFGHVHRIEQFITVSALGETHVGFTPGWLGDVKKAAEYIRSFADWMLGFATVDVEPNGNFHYQIHPIIDYKVRVDNYLHVWNKPLKKNKLMFWQ